MSREVWQQTFTVGESGGGFAVDFPNDWDSGADLFYLDKIWIDGVSTSVEVSLGAISGDDITNAGIAYKVVSYGGEQSFPNPWVMAKEYSFIYFSSPCVVRVSFFGNRRSGSSNPDIALVSFNKAIYEMAPTP